MKYIDCDNFVTIKHKSGLVVVIAYIKLPTIYLNNFKIFRAFLPSLFASEMISERLLSSKN